MNDVAMQQVWGAIRTLLGVGAGVLIGKGWVDATTATTVIGALMTLIPLAWSAYDKHRSEQATKAREATAVNVGIAVADRTPGVTPAVSAADAPAVIAAFSPVATGLTISPDSPVLPADKAVPTKPPFGVAKP